MQVLVNFSCALVLSHLYFFLHLNFQACDDMSSRSRKYPSGSEKRKKRKREDEFIASQKGALDKFVKVNSNPSRNDEELAIIAVEEQINGGSEENIDIQEDDNNVSDPENIADPSATECASVDD